MAKWEGPARRPGPAPAGWKEGPAQPLAPAACHSPVRPAGSGLAATGSAQARNVTREKPGQAPRRQVVIFGGSALRVLLSCHREGRAARRFPPLQPALRSTKSGGRARLGLGSSPARRCRPLPSVGGCCAGFRETSVCHEPAGLSRRLGAERAGPERCSGVRPGAAGAAGRAER